MIYPCQYCQKSYTRIDNLNRHLREGRCEILKLQNQQKENIFVNLVKEKKLNEEVEDKINKMKELNEIENAIKNDDNDDNGDKNINNLLSKLEKELNDTKNENIKIKEYLNKVSEQQEENNKIKDEYQKIKEDVEKLIKQQEEKTRLLEEKNSQLRCNNIKLQEDNLKLNKKMNTIITKNYNKNIMKNSHNTNNINNNNHNIQINNPQITLVEFGKEDLNKVDNKVYFEAMKKTGPALYQKSLEGIHFNPALPEFHNVYLSDHNRELCMKYKDEKWILDNWNTVYNELLNQITKFGYDKEQFMEECNEKGKLKGIDIIKNGMRWSSVC
jgi:chromosome segregation ATPase